MCRPQIDMETGRQLKAAATFGESPDIRETVSLILNANTQETQELILKVAECLKMQGRELTCIGNRSACQEQHAITSNRHGHCLQPQAHWAALYSSYQHGTTAISRHRS